MNGSATRPLRALVIGESLIDVIIDGDDENDAIFIDSNGNGLVDPGELLDMRNTGLSYARLNVYDAVRAVRALFIGGGTPISDPNGTIGSATPLLAGVVAVFVICK